MSWRPKYTEEYSEQINSEKITEHKLIINKYGTYEKKSQAFY
jgi:hypothetical protein